MSTLRKRTTSAIIWQFIGTFSKQFSGFLITLVLARILDPAEFGLIGIAMVVIVIAQTLIDFGFASGIIQSSETSDELYSSVFWVNCLLGLFFTLILYYGASAIGAFYEIEQVTSILKWLSPIFFINALSLVQMSIYRKKLNFKLISITLTSSSLISGVIAIFMAYKEFGVFSLVAQQLIRSSITSVVLWSKSTWKPKLCFSLEELKKLLSFSTYMFLDKLSSSILRKMDVLLIGKVLSPEILGYYTRGVTLKEMIVKYSSGPLTKVFYPVLSEVKDDRVRFETLYFRLVSIIAFISFGLTGASFLLSKDAITLLFGMKWLPTVYYFQLLILAFSTQALEKQIVNAFISQGLSKENFKIGLIRKFFRVILLSLVYFYDIEVFLISLIALNLFITVMNIEYMTHHLQLKSSVHYIKIIEVLLPVILFIGIYWQFSFDELSILHRFSLLIGFVCTYLGSCYLLKNDALIYMLEEIKKRIAKRKKKRNEY